MTSAPRWMGTVPAARWLGVSVREVYAAIDDGRLEGRWVNPGLQVEVAVDDSTAAALLEGPRPEHRR